MTWKWISSSHPISDIRDWSNQQRIEIRPDFQRKEVWSPAARILLMDTILRNIPMPKVFLQAVIRNNDTYRVVIDGQQRIKAILSFLRDDFPLTKPYTGEFLNRMFSELPENIREDFLSYKIDINEIRNAPDDIVRDIYSRVNKYTVALNKQELRRADFPGRFLMLSEELAQDPFFEEAKVFTVTNSKRMGDAEFVSELLASLLKGPQEKRESLDDFYLNYMEWAADEEAGIRKRFQDVLVDLKKIFDVSELDIAKTRFRQKADFYSLFAAIDDCRKAGGDLEGKPLKALREDLQTIDQVTEPNARVKLLSQYAVQCVSQANSIGSRKWRRDFLKCFLYGTYFNTPPKAEAIQVFREVLSDLNKAEDVCPSYPPECPVCDKVIKGDLLETGYLTWGKMEKVFQLSNATFIHKDCLGNAKINFLEIQQTESSSPEAPV
jgi:hypothetical protein